MKSILYVESHLDICFEICDLLQVVRLVLGQPELVRAAALRLGLRQRLTQLQPITL